MPEQTKTISEQSKSIPEQATSVKSAGATASAKSAGATASAKSAGATTSAKDAEATAAAKKTRLYIILGVIAAVTTVLILMLVIGMTSGKTLACTETNKGLYLLTDSDGNDATFDSTVTYTFTFNNKNAITSAKVEKTYSSENSQAIEHLTNLSKFIAESQYIEKFENETKGNDINISYNIKSEAFKLSMEEFYDSSVSDHLGLYNYYTVNDDFEIEFKYGELSDYLTYKNLKAEYESSSNITCK